MSFVFSSVMHFLSIFSLCDFSDVTLKAEIRSWAVLDLKKKLVPFILLEPNVSNLDLLEFEVIGRQ